MLSVFAALRKSGNQGKRRAGKLGNDRTVLLTTLSRVGNLYPAHGERRGGKGRRKSVSFDDVPKVLLSRFRSRPTACWTERPLGMGRGGGRLSQKTEQCLVPPVCPLAVTVRQSRHAGRVLCCQPSGVALYSQRDNDLCCSCLQTLAYGHGEAPGQRTIHKVRSQGNRD